MTLSAMMPILQRIILWSDIKMNQAKEFAKRSEPFAIFL
jgi:hypothetical protein